MNDDDDDDSNNNNQQQGLGLLTLSVLPPPYFPVSNESSSFRCFWTHHGGRAQ